jgi:hypothetical protein
MVPRQTLVIIVLIIGTARVSIQPAVGLR